MLKIAIIIGSTRPGNVGQSVGRWAFDIASARTDAEFSLLDLADFNLPVLDEAVPAMFSKGDAYAHEHTRAWSAAIAAADGYVFVTPEYNHGTSGALKNAIDFLYTEFADKAAAFIGYGYTMGARAVESLRLTMAALQVATVRPQVGISLFTELSESGVFQPSGRQLPGLATLLDHLVAWSGAMRTLRVQQSA